MGNLEKWNKIVELFNRHYNNWGTEYMESSGMEVTCIMVD